MKSIKDIINENFPKADWERISRKDANRDLFMQTLTEAFEENKVVKLNGEWHRGIGKTTFILEVAEEYRIPLLVNTSCQVKLIKDSKKNIEVYPVINELNGIKSKYILLDLNCNDNIIEKLKSKGLIPLGFICPPKPFKYELI